MQKNEGSPQSDKMAPESLSEATEGVESEEGVREPESGAESLSDGEGEVRTRVTSIAEEEERTGEKVDLPSPDKLVAAASEYIFSSRSKIVDLFSKMSKKQTIRTLTAIFTLPEDDVPVYLKTEEEKSAYAIAQKHLMQRFVVMQYHVKQEYEKRKNGETEEPTETEDE